MIVDIWQLIVICLSQVANLLVTCRKDVCDELNQYSVHNYIVSGAPYVLSVAVCAGSGSSVLRNVPVDLYITGEMSHHEVLHAMYNGTSVILCEHTNTERGYLRLIQKQLQDGLKAGTHIEVSEVDTDPLKIV